MKPHSAHAARAKKQRPPPTFAPLPETDSAAGIPERARAPNPDPELRRAMIAEAAFYRAEQRGFEPGRELDDWCAAESDIDARLANESRPTPCES
jgi:hypothetical protein